MKGHSEDDLLDLCALTLHALNQAKMPLLSLPIKSRTSRAPNSFLSLSMGRALPRPRTGDVN